MRGSGIGRLGPGAKISGCGYGIQVRFTRDLCAGVSGVGLQGPSRYWAAGPQVLALSGKL